VRRPLQVLETTASWVYTTATYRQANGATANQLSVVVGVAEDNIEVTLCALVLSDLVQTKFVSIGLNSTTTPMAGVLGQEIGTAGGQNSTNPGIGHFSGATAIGRNNYVWLEMGGGTGTVTWYGIDTGGQQSGLIGSVPG
jgi:hypothetical protein